VALHQIGYKADFVLSPAPRLGYNRAMPEMIAKAVLLRIALMMAATGAHAFNAAIHKFRNVLGRAFFLPTLLFLLIFFLQNHSTFRCSDFALKSIIHSSRAVTKPSENSLKIALSRPR
jgi:hypothetical protein